VETEKKMIPCGYRLCFVTFPERGEKKFCCDKHRVAEYNLEHPRVDVKSLQGSKIQSVLSEAVSENVTPVSIVPTLKKNRTFHYSSIGRDNERGRILENTLALLMTGEPSTREINEYTGSTRASSDISELREQGFLIECFKAKSDSGKDINRFRLLPEGKEKATMFFNGEWK